MENLYLPSPAIIKAIREETYDTKTFSLVFRDAKNREDFRYRPGQFVEMSVLGFGESPVSITSAYGQEEFFELCVRRVGRVTEALHRLSENDIVGIRGPFGRGFPIEKIMGRNLVIIGGGLGLTPLRPLIKTVYARRQDFGKMTILYGARSPYDLLFRSELALWRDMDNTEVLVTVDVGTADWQGNIGVVTTLFSKTAISAQNAIAVVCGPPIMFRFVIRELLNLRFPEEAIILSLERMMKCGFGKCGHCNIGGKYVCQDGPVFSYEELKDLSEAV